MHLEPRGVRAESPGERESRWVPAVHREPQEAGARVREPRGAGAPVSMGREPWEAGAQGMGDLVGAGGEP